MTKDKLRVLFYGDFECATGFSQCNMNIVKQLLKTDLYEIDVIGINYHGEPHDWPLKIYPALWLAQMGDNDAYKDVMGRQRVLDLLGSGKYDIFFAHQDHFNMVSITPQIVQTKEALKKAGAKTFKYILLAPIDNELNESQMDWVDTYKAADIPCTYTEFGKKEIEKLAPELNVRVMHLGTDKETYKPIDAKAFRKKLFGDKKFVVTNINRNQPRKDISRTIKAFAEFHKLRPNSFLYLHMAGDGDIPIQAVAAQLGLKAGEDYGVPANFEENQGYPNEVINQIYNASDVVISTTLGEGWGLSCTEAMATKTPVIFPDNTSLTEMIGQNDERGSLYQSGKTSSMWTSLGKIDLGRYRPLADVQQLVTLLCIHYDHPKRCTEQVDRAYEWVPSWDDIRWDKIFEEAGKTKMNWVK